jgi:TM2 domain-containing membrane protein YozV
MMKRDYYTTPKSNWITKTLWKAAGADEYILMRSTYSDHVKYATLGGIVCATGFMAALAGGYAFYIIFKEKAAAITESTSQVVEQSTDIKTALLSILFGIIWGLIIFNIDRFIVASTGKGDGTEAITWGEFRGAIPRIIMGIIIAITISKPVELRMFETEIDVKLHEKQQIEYNNQIKKVEMNFRPEVERIEDEIEALRSEISLQKENLERKTTIFQAEMDGLSGSGKKGKGPSAKEKERERDLAQSELNQLIAKNEPKIESLIEDKKAAQNKIKIEKAKAENVANGLNGLLERLHIAHEIAGFWITLFITLLFMAIELTPIFFKMMLIKSPYDFISDNLKALLKAEHGIEVKYDFYKDKEGVQRDLVINHQSEKMIREKMKLLQTQADLNEIVLEEWKNKEAANIKKDPSKYIDS